MPSPHHDPSPYFASSRIYRNPLYLRIEDVPGAKDLPDVPRLAALGRALDANAHIDRAEAYRLKLSALQLLFDHADERHHYGTAHAFSTWRKAEGAPLTRYATHAALAELFGPDYGRWPSEYRHPDSPAVARFAAENERRVQFHEWCQWQLFGQLAAAGTAGVGLISDLAVGFDPQGADGWAYQDLLARGCRVGAPPDAFNQLGQDWGLPPFIPWKLRAARYEPLVRTLRSSFAHCAGIRIDHVMGLFRLYWLPPGSGPRDGGYVRYPSDEILDLVVLEAHRAGAFVIGEDLGTVEDQVRDELADRAILSYRLLWFFDDPTGPQPAQSVAAITTHDLPTVAGAWTGADEAELETLHLAPDDESAGYFRRMLERSTGLPDDAPLEEVVIAAHRALRAMPATLHLATLEDALAVAARPNVPGTTRERPNWQAPLPKPLELVEHDPLTRRVAAAMSAPPDPAAPAFVRVTTRTGARIDPHERDG